LPSKWNCGEEEHEPDLVLVLKALLAKLEEITPVSGKVDVGKVSKESDLEVTIVTLDHRPTLQDDRQILASGYTARPWFEENHGFIRI